MPKPHALRLLAVALIAALLVGCAGVLPKVERLSSTTRAAAADSPLASIAREAGVPSDRSGVWPLLQASYALDARLALIENAHTSLDLQYYLIGDDSTGRPILRALRDAALRGVRVRLLVDDLYTIDMDRLLLGLAAYPNVEVRLFNPFITARDSSLRRLIALAGDFKRLNHRMHNKLFVADGAVAIVGGRNLADEYFLRSAQGNFIDFDLLLTGPVVPELSGWFDLYWNSEQAYPAAGVARASGRAPLEADEARAVFAAATAVDPHPAAPASADTFGAPPLRSALAQRRFRFLAAESHAYADSPDKIDAAPHGIAAEDTLTHRFLLLLGDAQSEVHLFSPYFIPGAEAIARIGELRARDVSVRVVTNSLAVSDEPLVSIGLERHRLDLLRWASSSTSSAPSASSSTAPCAACSAPRPAACTRSWASWIAARSSWAR